MQYLALNGFRHSLSRYFNSTVTCVEQFNWTKSNAAKLARTITRPTTVIGFSDGATAAITVGNLSPHVVKVYAHSPMFRQEPIRDNINLHLFRTSTDTTPTFKETGLVYLHYLSTTGPHEVQLQSLPISDHIPVRDLATFIMRIRHHQFHNCLPYLPQEIIRNG